MTNSLLDNPIQDRVAVSYNEMTALRNQMPLGYNGAARNDLLMNQLKHTLDR